MKIIIFYLMTILLLTSNLYSQQSIDKGIKIGLNMSEFYGDDVQNEMFRFGFCAGGYINFPLGLLSIQPEILYSMQGSNFDDENDFRMRLNYIEVPVLLKFNVGLRGPVKTNFFIGPSMGILLSANSESDVDDRTVKNDIKKSIKDMDFRVIFGAGIKTPISLIVDVRWSIGLTKLDDKGDNVDDFKNSVISMMVGYDF